MSNDRMTTLRVNLLIGWILCIAINPTILMASPWPNYGATVPVARYSQDPASEKNYEFGVRGTFMGYRDPSMSDVIDMASPLETEIYKDYNLIILINDNEFESEPERWGAPQTMRVYDRSFHGNPAGLRYYWGISTGIDRAKTKKGYYTPLSFSSRHWSKQYDGPMLAAVFFDGGKALHSSLSSDDLNLLGRRKSSHGCVHIEDYRANEIFHLIGHSGYGWVKSLTKNGDIRTNKAGEPILKRSYRTLIIIH